MRGARRGLTLAELILALGILAVAALSLLAAFLAGVKMMAESTNMTMATEVGRELLEQVKEDGYPETAVGRFDGRIPSAQDSATQFPPQPYPSGTRNGQHYTLVVDCQQHSPTTRLLRVEIHWGQDRRTRLATMVHQ